MRIARSNWTRCWTGKGKTWGFDAFAYILGCESPFRMPPVTHQDENRKRSRSELSSKPLFTGQGRWSQITLLPFEDSQLLNCFFRVSEEFRFYTCNRVYSTAKKQAEKATCAKRLVTSHVAVVTTPATVSGSHRCSLRFAKGYDQTSQRARGRAIECGSQERNLFLLTCRPGTHRISLFYYFTIFLLPFLVKLQEWWW